MGKSPPSISFSIHYNGQKQKSNENHQDLDNYFFIIEQSEQKMILKKLMILFMEQEYLMETQ